MSVLSGFHHVKLPVSDVARSRDWYQRVLGFEVVIEFVEDDVLMGVALADGAESLSIALRHDPARAAAL
jgi:catechol 2,3-dioxygenase-like lactoylglutathione lyase family enzyme